jgi:hypothetical protein
MQSLRLVCGLQRNRHFADASAWYVGEVRDTAGRSYRPGEFGFMRTCFGADPRCAERAVAEAATTRGCRKSAAALESYRWAPRRLPAESPERATALLGMASLETGQGKYADARRHAADASRLFDRLGDPVRASVALNTQGRAAVNRGRLRRGGTDVCRRTRAFPPRRAYLEGQTEQLGNLANVQFYLGRYADAGPSLSAGDCPHVFSPVVGAVGHNDDGGSFLPIRRRSFNGWAATRKP